MRTGAPLLAPVFRSDGQARLLAALVLSGEELSITELAERAELAYPTAHREVARLVDAGVLAVRNVGRTRLVRANAGSPLVAPIREILAIAAGPVPALHAALADVPRIKSAFLFGSFAERMRGTVGPAPQDIDVMVVGSPDPDRVHAACEAVAEQVHLPVNPTILTAEELGAGSGFLDTVRARARVHVMGERLWERDDSLPNRGRRSAR